MAKSLPKIGSSPGLPDTPRGRFAQGVALRTGLNPWVVYAWTLAENTDTSVKRRPFNFLNLKSEDGKGAVLGGVHSTNCDKATDGGCFPGYASVDDAIASTVAFIQKHHPGIRQSANKGAGDQLKVIGHSGWGTSYATLWKIYAEILRTIYQGDQLPANVAAGTVGGDTPTLPGGTPFPAQENVPAVSSAADFFASIGNALAILFSPAFWLRAGQIIAGAVSILAGTLILARGEIPMMAH